MGISAVILAGGRAQRMEGRDKGLLLLRGKPLIAWVLAQLTPQVDEILISANRNLAEYQRFGYPVLEDRIPGFVGPLAGLHSALAAANHPLVLSVPCDTPFLPDDLVQRLRAALEQAAAEIAVPVTGNQEHRAICLCKRELAHPLESFIAGGGRKVGEWQESRLRVLTPFPDEMAFLNLNTPEQLAEVEQETG